MTFNATMQNVTAERFDDPRYSRPRYRLRYSMRCSSRHDGYTCCSYKFKRDAQRRADELNAAARNRPSGPAARIMRTAAPGDLPA